MHRKAKPPQEEDSTEGAPLWIISFADMISLLMAFFVMLSTFSGFGPAEAERLQKALRAALAPNYYGGWYQFQPRTAVGPQAVAAGQQEKGSDRPTLEEMQKQGLLTETKAPAFKTRRLFVIESLRVFWGEGITLSPEGRGFLDALAAFANRMPNRIVVCENGPGNDNSLGLTRAVTVIDYLATQGVAKGRCSLGIQGMQPDSPPDAGRTLEVALLDESLYR
jgi:outer membrane protein OmpA-like peptidoglycan-associated protein